MASADEYESAQDWIVRFTDKGEELFRSFGGTHTLCKWMFRVSVPEQEGRTQKELVEQVRTQAIPEIYRECQKDGLNISLEDLSQLNSYDYLSGKRPT